MQKKIYSWANPRPSQTKNKQGYSIVSPDQTLSLRQIMDRYSRGMPLTGTIKNPLYYNGEFPDIAGLDLTEIQALKKTKKTY
ncbi:MAG: hypothetical protein [Microviridae sp.]|nr:MAG: hypothetical protein [Microviridae sp.]